MDAYYKEQLERTHRYYLRLKALSEGVECRTSSEEYIDDMHAFFQNCYHIKDWLKNDPKYTAHTNAQIENYVTNSQSLSLCADICNGAKHLFLSSKPRSKSAVKSLKTTKSMDWGAMIDFPEENSCPILTINFKFEHNGKNIDALELAEDAMESWDSFTKCNITSHSKGLKIVG